MIKAAKLEVVTKDEGAQTDGTATKATGTQVRERTYAEAASQVEVEVTEIPAPTFVRTARRPINMEDELDKMCIDSENGSEGDSVKALPGNEMPAISRANKLTAATVTAKDISNQLQVRTARAFVVHGVPSQNPCCTKYETLRGHLGGKGEDLLELGGFSTGEGGERWLVRW